MAERKAASRTAAGLASATLPVAVTDNRAEDLNTVAIDSKAEGRNTAVTVSRAEDRRAGKLITMDRNRSVVRSNITDRSRSHREDRVTASARLNTFMAEAMGGNNSEAREATARGRASAARIARQVRASTTTDVRMVITDRLE